MILRHLSYFGGFSALVVNRSRAALKTLNFSQVVAMMVAGLMNYTDITDNPSLNKDKHSYIACLLILNFPVGNPDPHLPGS